MMGTDWLTSALLLYSISLLRLMKSSSQAGYDFYLRKQREKKLPLS